jgi:acyl-CoA synthetase (AMP-forming)/AMP-acid ligase II
MYLTQGLHRALQQRPNAIASICGDRAWTFAQFGHRVARLAGALHRLGMKTGDRVGMLSLNSDVYLEYYLGVYWAGGVVNPVNTRWSVKEIAFSLDDCRTDILIVDDQFLPLVGEIRAAAPHLRHIIHAGVAPSPAGILRYDDLLDEAEPVADAYRSGEDLAGIFYTGGTTGWPKGVMLSHRGLYVNALGLAAEAGLKDDSVGLHAAPMFHLADGAFMNALLMVGACHVALPRFEPVAAMKVIETVGVTETLLVPTMIQMIADHPSIGGHDLGSLRTLFYGGSPINEALLERAERALPGIGFLQLYGMTELSPCATILTPEMHREAGRRLGRHRSAGRAIIGAQVKVTGPDGEELPRGAVGQVAVRGPGVMLGYWNRPAETAAALNDGWMMTGDGGRMDDDGYLFIVDRIKDMIVSGGENIYCAEVEAALASHPAVATCAIIGIPHELWGEAVHAFVVTQADAPVDEAGLIAHCKSLVANYKCPRSISFVPSLPLSGTGKVLKTELRAPFWEGRERSIA